MAETDNSGAAAGGAGGKVAFDKAEYNKLRTVVTEVSEATTDALWGKEGYSIGPELRAQPVQATWGIASQVGNSVNKLASQVRTYTDTLCEKTLPEYVDSVAKAAKILEDTDSTASGDATGNK